MEKFLVKIFEKYFLMDSFIDKKGYCKKMAKNGHVHEGGKIGRSDATPTEFIMVILMI